MQLRSRAGGRGHKFRRKSQELLSEGNKEEALEAYKKALSYDPSNRLILDEYRRAAGLKPMAEEKPKEIVIEQPIPS